MRNTYYYDILGINPDASERDIKQAYYKKSLQYHPDKNIDDIEEAERLFKLVSDAYQVLKDPEKRKAYDRCGRDEFNDNMPNVGGRREAGYEPSGFYFRSPFDVFSEFFGGINRDPFGDFFFMDDPFGDFFFMDDPFFGSPFGGFAPRSMFGDPFFGSVGGRQYSANNVLARETDEDEDFWGTYFTSGGGAYMFVHGNGNSQPSPSTFRSYYRRVPID